MKYLLKISGVKGAVVDDFAELLQMSQLRNLLQVYRLQVLTNMLKTLLQYFTIMKLTFVVTNNR